MTWHTSNYRQHLVLRDEAARPVEGKAVHSRSKRSHLQRWRD